MHYPLRRKVCQSTNAKHNKISFRKLVPSVFAFVVSTPPVGIIKSLAKISLTEPKNLCPSILPGKVS